MTKTFIILYIGEGKIWACIARTNYKSLPIKSLAFSADTSLLGVGFGNTLCIYNPETLQLRCVLSAPSGLDGSVSKMTISLPLNTEKADLDARRQKFIEKGKKMRAIIKSLLDSDEAKTLTKHIKSTDFTAKASKSQSDCPKRLNIEQKKMIFNRLLSCNSINLFQKIHICDKFKLHGRVPLKMYPLYEEYCERADQKLSKASGIRKRILNLSQRSKFKFAYKYHRSHVVAQSCDTSGALKRTVNSVKLEKSKQHLSNGVSSDAEKTQTNSKAPYVGVQKPTVQIKQVAFCTGEYAHLVIVCTEKRLLIWNLLTLRLQSAFKIEVDKLTVDLYTSLVAVVSKAHHLYVFLPNTPITLYQHEKLPKIDGMAWIPRKYPKSHSLTIDWQAHTELYFLSSDKQVRHLPAILCCLQQFKTSSIYIFF